MRDFTDREGQVWEVLAGRESWGTIVALFLPKGGGGEIRQAPMRASGYEDAEAELDAMGSEGIQGLLDASVPKET